MADQQRLRCRKVRRACNQRRHFLWQQAYYHYPLCPCGNQHEQQEEEQVTSSHDDISALAQQTICTVSPSGSNITAARRSVFGSLLHRR